LSFEEIVFEDDEGSELHMSEMLGEQEDDFAKRLIQDCFPKLSKRDQSIVRTLLQGYTQDEVAGMFHISQASVHRCLDKFRKLIIEEKNQWRR
jgi:DNA-directed RNA polymerase specialized sigma subunit